MGKDLEKLRLNMIRTLMEMKPERLEEVKNFIENKDQTDWRDISNEENVEFIDYSMISMKKDNKKKGNKPITRIMFL